MLETAIVPMENPFQCAAEIPKGHLYMALHPVVSSPQCPNISGTHVKVAVVINRFKQEELATL